MKTQFSSKQLLLQALLALAVAAFAGPASSARAQEKGATRLLPAKPIQTVQDVQAVKPGATVVTCCPKCKGTWVTVVERPPKGAHVETKPVLRHGCPGCETKIVTTGHGKATTDKVVHVCAHCGSKEAFCSALPPGHRPATAPDTNKPADHPGHEAHPH